MQLTMNTQESNNVFVVPRSRQKVVLWQCEPYRMRRHWFWQICFILVKIKLVWTQKWKRVARSWKQPSALNDDHNVRNKHKQLATWVDLLIRFCWHSELMIDGKRLWWSNLTTNKAGSLRVLVNSCPLATCSLFERENVARINSFLTTTTFAYFIIVVKVVIVTFRLKRKFNCLRNHISSLDEKVENRYRQLQAGVFSLILANSCVS